MAWPLENQLKSADPTALTCMRAFLKEAGSACAHTTTRLLDVGSKKAFFFLSSSPISSRRCWRTVRPAEWPLKHAVSLIHRRRNSSTQLNGYFGKQRQFLCNPDRESRKLLTGLFALRSLIFKRGVCTRKCTKDFWSITIKLSMTLMGIHGC